MTYEPGACTCETQVTREVLERFWTRVSGESWLTDLLLTDAEEAELAAWHEAGGWDATQ